MPLPLDDRDRQGRLYRWTIVERQPRCLYDAIDPALLSPEEVADILAGNQAARDYVPPAEEGEEPRPAELPPDPLADRLASPAVPAQVTLSDWRVGLIQMGRYAEVKAAVQAARDSGTVEGLIAWERFEYANHVFRAELHAMAPVFGFSLEEADASLVVADRIAQAALAIVA